jgi:hypothetical protein
MAISKKVKEERSQSNKTAMSKNAVEFGKDHICQCKGRRES